MAKPEKFTALSQPEYWDEKYIAEQESSKDDAQTLCSFEWYQPSGHLEFIRKHLPSNIGSCHILHLGCGRSTLTADLFSLGYINQTSIDFSRVVIDAMRLKYATIDTHWFVMDVRDLDIRDASINIAIDKGTLDSIAHGALWDPPDHVKSDVGKYVNEVARVLKPGGKWICITYQQPHFLKPMLLREELWELSTETLRDSKSAATLHYFALVMTKHQ